jgi:hypothetical protein
MHVISLSPVDLAIMVLYFAAVLGIGFYLKGLARSHGNGGAFYRGSINAYIVVPGHIAKS